jgi:hypothetical protein
MISDMFNNALKGAGERVVALIPAEPDIAAAGSVQSQSRGDVGGGSSSLPITDGPDQPNLRPASERRTKVRLPPRGRETLLLGWGLGFGL